MLEDERGGCERIAELLAGLALPSDEPELGEALARLRNLHAQDSHGDGPVSQQEDPLDQLLVPFKELKERWQVGVGSGT